MDVVAIMWIERYLIQFYIVLRQYVQRLMELYLTDCTHSLSHLGMLLIPTLGNIALSGGMFFGSPHGSDGNATPASNRDAHTDSATNAPLV